MTDAAEVRTDVPIPPVKNKRARKAKAAAVAATNPAASLINALQFLVVAQRKQGSVAQQHACIAGHWACASNEVMTVATPIAEDLTACPHTISFIEALKQCGDDMQIVHETSHGLLVQSGAFRGLIECEDFANLNIGVPDPEVAAVDDRLKFALEAANLLTTEGATHAHLAGVRVEANSAISTNGKMLLQAWHGINLPEMLIPKQSVAAIVKSGKPLKGFGYSGPSATFYFADGSWIKTQLFSERFPVSDSLLNVETNPFPIPLAFFQSVRTIAQFSKAGAVFFENGLILSDKLASQASTFKLDGLPNGMGFNAEYLALIGAYVKTAYFDAENSKMYWYGDNIRGIVMGLDMGAVQRNAEAEDKARLSSVNDDPASFAAQHLANKVRNLNAFESIEDDDIPF